MKFRKFTPEALQIINGLEVRPGEWNDNLKKRIERSFYIAKEDGSEVITAEHLRQALTE